MGKIKSVARNNDKKTAILNVHIPEALRRLVDAEKNRTGLPIRVIVEKALRAWLAMRTA